MADEASLYQEMKNESKVPDVAELVLVNRKITHQQMKNEAARHHHKVVEAQVKFEVEKKQNRA